MKCHDYLQFTLKWVRKNKTKHKYVCVYIDARIIIYVCAEGERTDVARCKPLLDSLQLFIVPFSDLCCVFENFHSTLRRGIQKSNTDRLTKEI